MIERKPEQTARNKQRAEARRRRKAKKNGVTTRPPERAPLTEIVQAAVGSVDKLANAGIQKAERAEQLLADVFVESLETVQDASAAFDLEFDEDGKPVIPAHWKAELPDDIALKRRTRIALAALEPTKSAPVALQLAASVVQNTIRMQNKQQNVMNVKKLNVAVIVGGTKHDYPVLDVDSIAEREDD